MKLECYNLSVDFFLNGLQTEILLKLDQIGFGG